MSFETWKADLDMVDDQSPDKPPGKPKRQPKAKAKAATQPKWMCDTVAKLASRPLGQDTGAVEWDVNPALTFAHPWYNAVTDRQRSIIHHVEAPT